MRASRLRAVGAVALLGLLLAAAGGAAVQGLLHGPREVPTEVQAPDADGDGVPDVVENALGTDPLAPAPSARLPEAWVERFGLDASDPDLAARTAAYPRPPESPGVYGPQGLPPEFRMSLQEVYAHSRPEGWDEREEGAWDSRLDPRRWDVGGSGVPYAWLIRHGLDPFDAAALDQPDPTRNVTWTPREAYLQGLHPRSPDGDGDGLADVEELRLGTSPRLFSTLGTGIADGWLARHGFDPLDPAAAYDDTDLDGLSNLAEFEASHRIHPARTLAGQGLDPRRTATGGGPVPDGWLVRHGLDPLEPGIAEKVTEERTLEGRDGATAPRRLTVLDEYLVGRPPLWNESRNGPWMGGSDPTRDDTDGDGLTDLEELTGRGIRLAGGPKWVVSDATRADTDADGLKDGEEHAGRVGDLTFRPTDPSAPDTDVDGLLDGEELGVVPWGGVTLPPLDPGSDDTDGDGLLDGAEAAMWLRRSQDAQVGAAYPWGPPEGRPDALQALAREGLPAARVAEALLPGGDLDGDGLPNALDPDADGDGLLDGWEAKPELYLSSPFAAPQGRPATDPANPDTDIDGLPDRWEVRHGLFDEALGGWNLDPSQWSSLRDGTSDADQDLDGDGVVWHAYRGGRAVATAFNATNRVELEAGSDPNRRSSSPDGIPDGWKIFWGEAYFSLPRADLGDVYPGAPGDLAPPPGRPPPRVGAQDDVPLGAATVARVRAGEGPCAGRVYETRDPAGATTRLCVTPEEMAFDYRAAARNATNPYLDDTDGDGVPDAWEAAWALLGQGALRVSPTRPDADADLDGDGLPNADEWRAGSNPYLADSDLGGAGDEAEWRLILDPFDPSDDARALDSTLDTDGDGVPDVAEALGRFDARGERIRTDPRDVDTDRDGLLDGRSLSEVLGRRLRRDVPADATLLESYHVRGLLVVDYPDGGSDVGGEATLGSDPSRLSTSGEGIPDGWAARHWTTPTEPTGLLAAYAHGRPAWWNESQHGVWRWGLQPGQAATRDHDGDGLDDRNGEDPIPYANRANALPRGDPREEGLAPLERLLRAQAYGGPPVPSDAPPRFDAVVSLAPLPSPLATNGTARFVGNVTTPSGQPVANATVVLSLETRSVVLGVALTNATGAFNATLALGPTVAAPAGSEGVPVFGIADGTGVHANAEETLRSLGADGRARVFAWTYNESFHPPPRQLRGLAVEGAPVGGMRSNESARQEVSFTLETRLSLALPDAAPVGAPQRVEARLVDALGRPVPAAVLRVDPPGENVTTDEEGRAALTLALPAEPGPLVVNASFGGRARWLAANATATLRVTETTRLDLVAPPLAARLNDTVLVAGALRTARGAPVPDAPVRVQGPAGPATATTDAQGRFDVTLHVPPDATVGNATVRAAYAGNGTLVGAESALVLPVEGAPRWDAAPVRAPVGSQPTLAARLLDLRGQPLAGRDVTLRLPDGSLLANRTDDEGRAAFRLDLRGAAPGERTARLSFSGPAEGSAEASVPVVATTGTRLALDPAPVLARGPDARLSGTLADLSGAPLARQAVLLRVGNLTLRALTAENGSFEATLPTAGLRAGPLQAAAAYAGSQDGVRGPSDATLPLRLADAPTLRLDARDVLASRPVVQGRLTTLLGEPLPGRDLRARTDGGDVGAFTDVEGRFQALLTPLASRALGPVDVAWRLDGDDRLLPLGTTTTLLVKDHGALRVDAPAALPERGLVRIPFALLDSRDRPAPDARLAVRLDGQELPVRHEGGVATFELPRDVRPGPHRLALEARSDTVSAPPVERALDVQRAARLALVSAPALRPGETGEALVRLESAGAPLAGERLLVHGGRVPLEVATGADGVARIPVTYASHERALLQVAYPGRGESGPAALALRVAEAPSAAAPLAGGPAWVPYALAALLLLAAGAAFLVMARRRRDDPARVLRRASRRLRSARPDVGALYEAYLSLLGLAGLDEDQADAVTFGALLSRFLREGELETEAALLTDVFNRAVYAPALLGEGDVRDASDALDRMAARMAGA